MWFCLDRGISWARRLLGLRRFGRGLRAKKFIVDMAIPKRTLEDIGSLSKLYVALIGKTMESYSFLFLWMIRRCEIDFAEPNHSNLRAFLEYLDP